MMSSPRLLYLDQNAWIALAHGAWDATAHPAEHSALMRVVKAVQGQRIIVPLSFTNIYETAKINDPLRRRHLAHVQSTISGGKVIRSRRRIFGDTLLQHIARRSALPPPVLADGWFLSDLWFEAAADYTPETYGFEISERALDLMRQDPAYALFSYLCETDEAVRLEGVRQYSASSAELLLKLDARRKLAAGEAFALRLRAYGAQLILEELDFIFLTAKRLGLSWYSVGDIGRSLLRSIVTEVPVMNIERELAVRLEDQQRETNENDLRDMLSFTTALPVADILVGEKAFVGLARQAKLGEKYDVVLLTKVMDLTDDLLSAA
ncbi:hypothetical protein [Phenylobacterium sp.]|uniref:hypothetical protein n=1 Tax=Phenylobacterium sp. TaxID=1871053 RepID=UPI00289F4B8B|nr:hypothetical protein [Phenylobacterium sp.]